MPWLTAIVADTARPTRDSPLFRFVSVCKSCLVKHLEENNTCPTCENVIHQSHPLQYISFDRTMQDIVYKLVPNLMDSKWGNGVARDGVESGFLVRPRGRKLNRTHTPHQRRSLLPFADEMQREREFYKSRNLPCPKDMPQVHDSDDKANEQAHQEADYHRQDEQVNVCLECISDKLRNLKRRFIRCSSQITITHLKKFLAKKVLNGIDRYKDVSVCLCVQEPVGEYRETERDREQTGESRTMLICLLFTPF